MTQFATVFGIIYLRPRATIGYGAPFWQFVGVDAWWMTNTAFTTAYLGWRANLPWLDVQIGGRKVYPFNRRLLPIRRSHNGDDLAFGDGDVRSEYHAIDFETLITLPLLHGGVFNANQAVWVDAPRDRHLYEESLRVIMQPPFMLGTRTGYVYGFGASQDLKAGIMVEWLITPHREKNAVRVGPVALYTFSRHFDAQFAFSPNVYGPDELGLFHGTYALLGLQHRYAVRFESERAP